MTIPKDEPVSLVLARLKAIAKEEKLDKGVKEQLDHCTIDLEEALEEWWDGYEDEDDASDIDGEDDHDVDGCGECPSCAGADIPKIIQICLAPPNWKAVFAEADSVDPTKMMVDDVVAFGVIEFPEGGTDTTGLVMGQSNMVPCELVNTFIGYLKPGQDPSTLSGKVSEFLKKNGK